MNEMTTVDKIKSVLSLIVMIGVPVLMVTGFVREILRSRREFREKKQRIHEAIDKIMADGKVEGPKGKFVWRHFGRKWVDYANGLPPPRQDKSMPSPDKFPNYPHHGG